jgi:GH25 family lysozyme M1 (1,4-beta-N-acetylmuramidase)
VRGAVLTGAVRSGTSAPEPPGATQPAATAAPQAQGIDIGDYQDKHGPIQWDVVAGQYQFAYIKASEGNYYVNPYFAGDLKSALKAGLYAGAYTFATPDQASGAAEADYLLQQLGATSNLRLLVPMIDLEEDPYGPDSCYGLDPADMISWISSFSAEIEAALEVRPIIYTQAWWWNLCTGGTNAFNGSNPLWVGSDGSPSTSLPEGFGAWAIWQSIDGSAAGVTGPVDVDTFNGPVGRLASQLTVPHLGRWRLDPPLTAHPARFGTGAQPPLH